MTGTSYELDLQLGVLYCFITLILSREVDLVSPLLTPLTFEGLIDEVFSISSARIQVDASLLGDDDVSSAFVY